MSLAASLVAAGPAGAFVIDVDTTADSVADDGFCSLREAVTATNNNVPVNGADDCDHDGMTGPDTIRLQASTTYQIANTDADPGDDNVDGDFDVLAGAGGLTIEGVTDQGIAASVVDADAKSRAFHLAGSSGVLTLRKLRIENGVDLGDEGDPSGGGGVAASTGVVGKGLVLDGVTVTSSQTVTGSGGGIHTANPSSLSITGSTISSNTAAGAGAGGGIFAQAGLTLTNSLVLNNQATDPAATQGGGGIRVSGGSSTITGSATSGNTATGGGGGIHRDGGGLEIHTSTISNNHALGDSGGGGIRFRGGGSGDLLIEDSTLAGNDAVGTGGGLSHAPQTTGTTLTVRRTAIVGNTLAGLSTSGGPARGGGILSGGTNPGPTLIEDAVVESNTIKGDGDDSGHGAGLAFNSGSTADYTVRRSTIAGNGGGVGTEALTAMLGGGLLASSENSLKVVNSTISGNHGGDAPVVQGGGLIAALTPAAVVHSTLTGNVGDGVNGDAMQATSDNINFHNIDVRGTVVDNGANACDRFFGGTITSQGYNLDAGTSCGFTNTGDDQSTSAQLDPLALNNGPQVGAPAALEPLETHAPDPTSAAVDRVPSTACVDEPGPDPLTVDQRGKPRPDDGDSNGLFDCEAGSVELQVSGAPPAPDVVSEPVSAITHTSATLNGRVDANGAAADCDFQYVDHAQFMSDGFSSANVVDCVPDPVGGTSLTAVSAAIDGLAPGTVYHSRVSATNGGGTDDGADQQFTTSGPIAPDVLTEAASAITQTSATLNGTVDANGAAADCEFAYVDDAQFQIDDFASANVVDCVPNTIGGDVVTPVSAAIAGLAPGTLYHSRVSATNGGGTDHGLDEQFTTLAAPASPPAAPTAQPLAPSNLFDFGKLKRKKKKGIAFLIVFVPGPGEVGLAGKGIKNRGISAATATKAIATNGGRVKLKVVPTKKGRGKKIRQRLRNKGKAKLKVFVSYLPTGGTINTEKKKVNLVRR